MYSDLTVNGGANPGKLDFAPGTYFFYNATISFGGTVTCSTCTSAPTSGVTLVLLGTTTSLTISSGATVNLSAPAINGFSSALNGVLIDDQAQNDANPNKIAVNINGGGNVKLGGAMYFPHADVSWGGTAANDLTTCSMVIANTLTINGNAYLSTNGCDPDLKENSKQPPVVALVQ